MARDVVRETETDTAPGAERAVSCGPAPGVELASQVGNRAFGRVLARSPNKPPTWWDSLLKSLSQPLGQRQPLGETLVEAFEKRSKHGVDAHFGTGYPILKREILATWERRIAAGDALVKVVAGTALTSPQAQGYIGLKSSIRNKGITAIEDTFGFARGFLGNDALILEFDGAPKLADVFEARGLTTWDPGTHPSFVPGAGAPQWQLTKDFPVKKATHITGKQVYLPATPAAGTAPAPAATRSAASGAVHGATSAVLRGVLRALNLVDLALLAMQFILMPLQRRLAETNEEILASLWRTTVGKAMERKAAEAMERWWNNPVEDPAVRGERAWVNARWRVVMEKQDTSFEDTVAALSTFFSWPQIARAVELEHVWIDPEPAIPGPSAKSIQREREGRREVVHTVQGSVLIADPEVLQFLRERRSRRSSAMRWHRDLAKGLGTRGLREGPFGAAWERNLFFGISGHDYRRAAEALDQGMDAVGGSDRQVDSYLSAFRSAIADFRTDEAAAGGFDSAQKALLEALEQFPERDELDLPMSLGSAL